MNYVCIDCPSGDRRRDGIRSMVVYRKKLVRTLESPRVLRGDTRLGPVEFPRYKTPACPPLSFGRAGGGQLPGPPPSVSPPATAGDFALGEVNAD
jgi:hypothetical protein